MNSVQRRMSADPSFIDPRYMRGDSEMPEYFNSTDGEGGVLFRSSGPLSRKVAVDYPYFTGGTFLYPEVLPPVRDYKLQGITPLI